MLQDITRIISIITVVQLLLFAVFLWNHKKGKVSSNRILSMFLIANALFIINFIIAGYRNSLSPFFIHFHLAGFPFVFLFGPLLYFYTKSLIDKKYCLKKWDYLHYIPFLLVWLYIVVTFEIHSSEVKGELIRQGKAIAPGVWYFLLFFMNMQIFAYLILSLKRLQEYRLEIRKYYSSVENFNLTWLSIVIIGFGAMWLIDLFHFVAGYFGLTGPVLGGILTFLSLAANFIFANLVIYKGLQHPEVISGPEDKNELVKYEKSQLSEKEKQEYLSNLLELMKTQKPYLNSSLTLKELADRMGISTRYLSQVINESLNKNFYDFVNGYRIEEAKEIMIDSSNERKTMLEILYEVGFNSKSSFNSAFSKYTGTTPSEFKRLYKYQFFDSK